MHAELSSKAICLPVRCELFIFTLSPNKEVFDKTSCMLNLVRIYVDLLCAPKHMLIYWHIFSS